MLDDFVFQMQNALSSGLPAFKKVESHAGRFSLDDVKRISTQTPALLLSCLSVLDVQSAPSGRMARLRMAAFILVGDGRDTNGHRVNKNTAALQLVDGVMAVLDGDEWILPERPDNIAAENLYSASSGMSIALWAVTWQQPVMLGTGQESLDGLHDFLRAGIVWDTTPPLSDLVPIETQRITSTNIGGE